MKETIIKRIHHGLSIEKAKPEQHSAKQFKRQCKEQNARKKRVGAAHRSAGHRFLAHLFFLNRQSPPYERIEHDKKGHITDAADLKIEHHDDLSEKRIGGTDINGG